MEETHQARYEVWGQRVHGTSKASVDTHPPNTTACLPTWKSAGPPCSRFVIAHLQPSPFPEGQRVGLRLWCFQWPTFTLKSPKGPTLCSSNWHKHRCGQKGLFLNNQRHSDHSGNSKFCRNLRHRLNMLFAIPQLHTVGF